MGRITILATALAAIVGSAGVGWYAGSQIKSPAQVAAEADPPAPSLITVSVEMRTLSSDVITRGDVRYDEPVELELDDPPSTVGGTAIVTRAPHEGGTIDEGEILLEVSGRPIIVLRGELPMYRTMRPGDQGDDVRQLEEALARLDLEPGAVDGVFDDATERAIGDLYGRHGFLPPGPTEQEAAELQAAIEAVAAAKLEVSAARRELGNASQGPSQASILSAEAEARNAERMLEDTESQCAIDEDAAAASVEAAEDTLARATADLTRAETRLTEALGGIHPDTGLPPTAEELDALEADVRSARTAVESAQEALAEAERQESLVRRSCESAIAGAEDQVAIANALLQEARRPPDTSSARGYLSDSKQRLTAAQESLASVEARVGTIASRSEIVYLSDLPARVDRVRVERGDPATGPIASITSSEMIVASSVSLSDAPLVHEGSTVVMEEIYREVETTGIIVLKADRPGTNDVSEDRIYLEIALDEHLDDLAGANVKVTIPVESTGGDVMVVPVAALSAAPDGSARVQVDDGAGSTRFVTITTGLAADGYVEITHTDGLLATGDLVVVGRDLPSSEDSGATAGSEES